MSVVPLTARRGRPAILRRAAALGPLTTAAAVICAVLIVVAILGPLIVPYDPTAIDPLNVYAPSSGAHLLGTDDTGRDILSRLIAGARPSLAGPALVVVLSAGAGTLLAVAGAWHGGWLDATVARLIEVLFAFPGLILAVVAAAIFGTGFLAPVLALSVAYVPLLARIIRSAALKERSLPYVSAMQIQGSSGVDDLPAPPAAQPASADRGPGAVGFGYAMVDLAAISYLGLGIQPPAPDWGVMVANGQPGILSGHPASSRCTRRW